MKNSNKKSFLKFNRNHFPLELSWYLNLDIKLRDEEKGKIIGQFLKSWYQNNFQKNNRWNKTLIYSLARNYSETELLTLGQCFPSLFNMNRTYNQPFLRFVHEYRNQKETEKEGSRHLRLKVDQETFKEIIQYFGDLKREGKIKNANHEIAKILKKVLEPDVTFESPTILDRLKNKKGYY